MKPMTQIIIFCFGGGLLSCFQCQTMLSMRIGGLASRVAIIALLLLGCGGEAFVHVNGRTGASGLHVNAGRPWSIEGNAAIGARPMLETRSTAAVSRSSTTKMVASVKVSGVFFYETLHHGVVWSLSPSFLPSPFFGNSRKGWFRRSLWD